MTTKILRQQSKFYLTGFVLLLIVAMISSAQSIPATALQPGEAVEGRLSSNVLSQIYLFTGASGQDIQLVATSRNGLNPVLVLTDITGAKLAEVADDDAEGTVRLAVTLPLPGTYYVTVFSAPGSLVSEGDFELVLMTGDDIASVSPEETPETPATEAVEVTQDVEATEAPVATEEAVEATEAPVATEEAVEATEAVVVTETVSDPDSDLVGSAPVFVPSQDVRINDGIRVELNWNTPIDLNLEVRDPLGNAIYFDQTTSSVGGQFGPDSNGLCEIVKTNPAENVTWEGGFLPTGSYEILVFYREACEDTAGATDFTLTVTVNGQAAEPIEGRLAPPVGSQASVYVAGFKIAPDGQSVTLNQGGVYPDAAIGELAAPVVEVAAIAEPITRDVPLSGTIAGTQYYQAYSFDALANELVSVTLTNTSGNLDTLLQIVNSSGIVVSANDDADSTTRNSALSNIRLIDNGTYYLVATRYAKNLGSTEGEFDITLTGTTDTGTTTSIDLVSLGLPAGDVEVLLKWNTNADLQLLVRDPVGNSIFDSSPTVSSGGQLVAQGNVDCENTSTSPVSYIYWPEGILRSGTYEIEVWYQRNCDDTSPVQFDLAAIVDDDLIISEQRISQPGQRFVVSFDVNADNTTTVRQGGYIGKGAINIPYQQVPVTEIGVGQTAINQQLTQDAYFNVFQLEAVAGQKITISMAAETGSTLDTRLILLAPNGQLAIENDDVKPGEITNSSIVSYEIPFDGTYTIIATRYAGPFGGTTGKYTMSITEG